MPTPSSLANRLTTFCMNALGAGNALDAKSHRVVPMGSGFSLVTWQSDDTPDLANMSVEDVESYLFFLENGHYSILCNDGAIIQLSFKIKRGKICHHRLAYIPCPVYFDVDRLMEESLSDVVLEQLFKGDPKLIPQRGVVRFDFDPEAASAEHSACHLTLNFDQTRIPTSRTFDAATFFTFLDRHFLASRDNVGRLNQPFSRDGTIDASDLAFSSSPHVYWNEVA